MEQKISTAKSTTAKVAAGMTARIAAKNTLFMLPCAGASPVGQLTVQAVQELVLEGRGEWVRFGKIVELIEKLSRGGGRSAGSPTFIAVDGCGRQCLRKYLKTLQYDPEFHLSLEDLGIAEQDACEIAYETMQLAKDGIIAGSTRVSEQLPMFLGGCGCRA